MYTPSALGSAHRQNIDVQIVDEIISVASVTSENYYKHLACVSNSEYTYKYANMFMYVYWVYVHT
jgi:hypothetical protein